MTPVLPPEGGVDAVEIVLDTSSAVPPVEQVQQQIRDAVRLGQLPVGVRLPTVRRLAGHLGVSNGVVARAYRALEDEGLLRTAGRGGTTVAAAPTSEEVEETRRAALVDAATAYADRALTLGAVPEDALAAAQQALSAAAPSRRQTAEIGR